MGVFTTVRLVASPLFAAAGESAGGCDFSVPGWAAR